MAQPYIGEIRLFAGNFAPVGWNFCNGQLLSIADNTTLYQLIGTTYGGDGVNTFGLPDLRSRIPVHQGNGHGGNYVMGQLGGAEQVALTTGQIPQHTHTALAQSAAGNQQGPTGGVWLSSSLAEFSSAAPNAMMNPAAVSAAGSGQSHNNIMPYLAINFIIALLGIFPSQG